MKISFGVCPLVDAPGCAPVLAYSQVKPPAGRVLLCQRITASIIWVHQWRWPEYFRTVSSWKTQGCEVVCYQPNPTNTTCTFAGALLEDTGAMSDSEVSFDFGSDEILGRPSTPERKKPLRSRAMPQLNQAARFSPWGVLAINHSPLRLMEVNGGII